MSLQGRMLRSSAGLLGFLLGMVMPSVVFGQDDITVTLPAGGERFQVGSTVGIQWDYPNADDRQVTIRLSIDGGETFSDVFTDIANDGVEQWTVPDSPSTECIIRIFDSQNPTISDDSGVFEIFVETGKAITVISPKQGDVWVTGYEHKIRWQSFGNIGEFVEITLKGGAIEDEEGQRLKGYADADRGWWGWDIPEDDPEITPSTGYTITVKSERFPSVSGTSDSFEITDTPFIVVTSPNGGETLEGGTTEMITWDSTGGTGSYVFIDFSTDGGSSWRPIVLVTANDGSYSWLVPNVNSSACLVRVVSLQENLLGDTSDAPFTITAVNRLTLTSPNGGEVWSTGSSHDITWSSTGDVGPVTIAYSTDGGSTWNTIVELTEDDGSFRWEEIPATPSETASVGISSASDSQVSDVSNASFVIVGLSIDSPNGGEFLQSRLIEDISWSTAGGVGSSVSLSLSTDGGQSWETIVEDTPNDGSYPWTVPTITCLECLVGVGSTLHPTIFDESDARFFIGIPAILADLTSESNLDLLSPDEEALVTVTATSSDTGLPVEEGTPLTISDEEPTDPESPDPVSLEPAVLLDTDGRALFQVRGGSVPVVTIVQGKVVQSSGDTVTEVDSFAFSFVEEAGVTQCASFVGPTVTEGVYTGTLTISEANCDNVFEVTATQEGDPAQGYFVLFVPPTVTPTGDFIVLGNEADSEGRAAALLKANEQGEEALTVTTEGSALAERRVTVCGDTSWEQVTQEFSEFLDPAGSVQWSDVEESYGDYLGNPCS